MPVVLLYVEKQTEIPLEINSYTLGRGLLECDNDKRISRSHGLIKVSENYEVTLKSTHTNPIFLTIQNNRRLLKKDQELTLANGDRFSLLPDDKFSYVLKFLDMAAEQSSEVRAILRVRNTEEVNEAIENGELSNSNSSTIDNTSSTSNSVLEPTLNVNSQANSRKRSVSTEETESSKKARLENDVQVENSNSNAPTSTTAEIQTINSSSTPSALDPTTSTDGNLDNNQSNQEKENIATNSEQESTTTIPSEIVSSSDPVPSTTNVANDVIPDTSSSSTSTVPIKIEPTNETPSSSNSNPDTGTTTVKTEPDESVKTEPDCGTANNSSNPAPTSNQPLNSNPSNRPNPNGIRESCQHGIRCYRRTQDHRAEFAHPGDHDYRRPDFPPAPNDAPPCPFGAACYRRNPVHFREYQHPAPDAVPVLPNVRVIVNVPRPNRPGNYDYLDDDMSDNSDFGASDSDDNFLPHNGYPFDSSSSGVTSGNDNEDEEDDYDNFEGEE